MQNALKQIEEITAALNKVALLAKENPFGLAGLLAKLDLLTEKYTGYPTFVSLVHAPSPPTFCKAPPHLFSDFFKREYAEIDLLALCYDMAQEARRDTRRAFIS